MALILVMAGMAPLLWYLRRFSENKAANAKDGAEAVLYEQLSRQVGALQESLNDVYGKYRALQEEHMKDRARLAKLEECETTILAYRAKLEDKDRRLDAKDSELQSERAHNRQLTLEVISLKDRISELERRLILDEQKFTHNKEFHHAPAKRE